MSVSNIVGSALAGALSRPVQKPSAPQTDGSQSVPVSLSTPSTSVRTQSPSQPFGKDLLASLLPLQDSSGSGGPGDTAGVAGGSQSSKSPSRRHSSDTLETGSPDLSRLLASGTPPTAAGLPATAGSASSPDPAALRAYARTSSTQPAAPAEPT
jgi:hypothetical protein